MEKFLKYKRHILMFSLVLFLIITGGIYYFYSYINNKVEAKEEVEVIEEKIEENIEKEVTEEIPILKEYTVDVKGAVNNPGVYKLTENNIVNDAINLAGGLSKYADTKCINLSKKIIDEMVIYVYTKSETWQILNSEKETKKETNIICEEVKNDAHIEEKSTEVKEEKLEDKIEKSTNALVNINNDGVDKLSTLPGIGEAKAKTIIEYRETNGNFKNIEELKNVSGIGDSTFEKIKSLITV